MKLLPAILIKDFPPKLRELALKRAFDINGLQIEMALEKKVNSCFSWHASPEGHNFWSDVYNGKEFEWEEDVEVSTEEFKKREGIVEAVEPQAATQTAYVSSPGVEPFLSKCGKYISATNPYANPCVDMSWGVNPYVYKSRRTGGTKAYTEKISKYIEAYMGRTPYFRETSEEVNDELREWMGIKSAKKLAGNGVEKLPSAILVYKKEKVKRKLI